MTVAPLGVKAGSVSGGRQMITGGNICTFPIFMALRPRCLLTAAA